MKKENWIFGLALSIALPLIALTIKTQEINDINLGEVMYFASYNFLYNFFVWILLMKMLRWHLKNNYIKSQHIYSTLSIVFVSCLIVPYHIILSSLNDNFLQLPDKLIRSEANRLIIKGLLTSSFFYFIVYYLHLLEEKRLHAIEIEKLKQAQLEANLSSLKEQLNPHFLFNTLNTLSSLTREKLVKDYISEFANVYRYMLVHNKLDKATVKQEITFIASYLYIIKVRMEDAINIQLHVEEGFFKYLLPPLSLQLLIENAIKHNVASRNKPLNINIYNEGDCLIVNNNFRPKKATQNSTGIGLNNLMQRYRLLFDKEMIIEKASDSFNVKLPLVKPEL